MNRENVICFNNIKWYLSFEVLLWDQDEPCDIRTEVGCYEDIEMYFRMYFDRNWVDLFQNKYEFDPYEISYVNFKGIYIGALDENHNRLRCEIENSKYANISFNVGYLAEDNAKKINEIRKIIG